MEADAASAGENVMPPFVFLVMTALPTTAKGQLLCARKWGERLVRFAKDSGWRRPFAKPHGADRRIAVGYLSAEFHEHATAYLMAELFEVHDRGFEVVGYSIGSDDGGAMQRRLVGAFDRFVDLREASFLDSAKRIAEDGIDILVDLKGYTRFADQEIFALRPAPIQVNYLGYPGTMGTELRITPWWMTSLLGPTSNRSSQKAGPLAGMLPGQRQPSGDRLAYADTGEVRPGGKGIRVLLFQQHQQDRPWHV